MPSCSSWLAEHSSSCREALALQLTVAPPHPGLSSSLPPTHTARTHAHTPKEEPERPIADRRWRASKRVASEVRFARRIEDFTFSRSPRGNFRIEILQYFKVSTPAVKECAFVLMTSEWGATPLHLLKLNVSSGVLLSRELFSPLFVRAGEARRGESAPSLRESCAPEQTRSLHCSETQRKPLPASPTFVRADSDLGEVGLGLGLFGISERACEPPSAALWRRGEAPGRGGLESAQRELRESPEREGEQASGSPTGLRRGKHGGDN